MKRIESIQEACRALEEMDVCLETERIPIAEAYGRILAEKMEAEIAVPAFRRSAFDGYALRSADIKNASAEHPVTLKVTETIPAGSVGRYPVTEGTAARIMTGAMLPKGADTVVKHEDTRFTEKEVFCLSPSMPGNIVEPGEDVRKGTCLMQAGKVIGPADAAVMAGQGKKSVLVYRKPIAAVLSTGSELLSPGEHLAEGKIYNTNPFLISGYLKKYGMMTKDYGIAEDDPGQLAIRIKTALQESDLVITTGGVSAGDFDCIPGVMDDIGARILFHRLPFKPGGAMLAAEKEGKMILGLSGNPGAAAVGLLRICLPYIKKLCGRTEAAFEEAEAVLEKPLKKSGKGTRILRGKAQIRDGRLVFCRIDNQRNGSVSSMLDCDLLGEIPPGGSGPEAGEKIKVYFI